jgi:hypothetical protein
LGRVAPHRVPEGNRPGDCAGVVKGPRRHDDVDVLRDHESFKQRDAGAA